MSLLGRKVAIVGNEAAKFTPATEAAARALIRKLIAGAQLVISGDCHLGGVDIYTEEEAAAAGIPFKAFSPKFRNWMQGYMPRNKQIAEAAGEVHSISVRELPAGFSGMPFDYCYHCNDNEPTHVKSGGCWTAKYARKLGKPGIIHII